MTKKRIAALALVAIVAAGALYFAAIWWTLPDVSYLARENPEETALMRERGAKRVQHWVPLEAISETLIDAVIVAEDGGFYYHGGFDFYEMREAFERNWEEGRAVRGASTITQQLAKNLFLSTERTYTRKLKEALLTYRLEKAMGKKRILELYLNVIEWGDGVYGAEAAARDVFGKSASKLDHAEAAALASMIPNPLRLDPCKSPRAIRTRQERILNWMRRANRIDDEELERALSKELELRKC